ncbi:hypothetical protein GDO81_008805 [Engystomops pustulosus]|uniref:Uncharacterized protein n=1 Tax=Engystomops pustulosus TaxID=76066 RepID=A0AAV7CH44_ENGPU|nr:hypothetical protein GDO81_008805 [Engystomops pustulosus]
MPPHRTLAPPIFFPLGGRGGGRALHLQDISNVERVKERRIKDSLLYRRYTHTRAQTKCYRDLVHELDASSHVVNHQINQTSGVMVALVFGDVL